MTQRQKSNRPTNYEFLPYTGTGTEVVDDLDSSTTTPASRLLAVATWHDHPSRQSRRNRAIAAKLRLIAGAANDNSRQAVAA